MTTTNKTYFATGSKVTSMLIPGRLWPTHRTWAAYQYLLATGGITYPVGAAEQSMLVTR